MSYTPHFTITNKILKLVGEIEASREVITNVHIAPEFEYDLFTETISKRILNIIALSGSESQISQNQIKHILRGESVVGEPLQIQEVVNLKTLFEMVSVYAKKQAPYSVNTLQEMHTVATAHILPPEKSGSLRKTEIVLRDPTTQEVIFSPPASTYIPYLVDSFFEWSTNDRDIHVLLKAAITMFVLSAIYPFIEGNLSVIHAFTYFLLEKEGYAMKNIFLIEDLMDEHYEEYSQKLFTKTLLGQDISNVDLTEWITFYLQEVSIATRVTKEKLWKYVSPPRIHGKIGPQVALSARQVKLIEFLSESTRGVMKDFAKLHPMISEDTILRDLKDLVKKGIIEKEGSTKAASYILKA